MAEIIENNNNDIELPESYGRQKLNSLYRAIPLKDTTFRLLRKYFCAMSNLYKIVPLSKVKEIILSQNPGLVSDEEFLAFCEVARHENEGYYILAENELYTDGKPGGPLDRELINGIVIETYDDEDLARLRAIQGDKPYYITEKKSFLEYADPCYVEDTPAKEKLAEFLRDSAGVGDDMMNNIIALFTLTDIEDINDALSVLKDMHLELPSDKIKSFTPVYFDFMNNIRIPENRGYTPNEMDEIMKSSSPKKTSPSITFGSGMRDLIKSGEIDANELRNNLINTDELPDELRFSMLKELNEISPVKKPEKIGRNEPCPCGSGKKYKKCCGR